MNPSMGGHTGADLSPHNRQSPIGRFSPPIGRPTMSSWGGDRADLMGKGFDRLTIDRSQFPPKFQLMVESRGHCQLRLSVCFTFHTLREFLVGNRLAYLIALLVQVYVVHPHKPALPESGFV
jgi:hypothetical protein